MELTPIGEMRQQIDILAPSAGAAGPSGLAPPGTATLGAGLWCKIESLHGQKLLIAQQIAANSTHIVKLRWLAGVTEQCKVVFGSRTFEIISPIDLEERQTELWLYCK